MAEILGLTLTDFPFIRMKPRYMPWVLQANLAAGWKTRPHLCDSRNWPEPMRQAWGSDQDQGFTAGKIAQQHQIEQFKLLKRELDQFQPDLIVLLYRDSAETFAGPERPKFWISAHEQVRAQLYCLWGFFRGNYFEDDPDRFDLLTGHRPAAMHLAGDLKQAGLECRVVDEPIHANGLGHNALASAVHLDWDQRKFATPIVPIGIDPFRFGRERNNEGLSPWDKNNPNPPLTPAEAFQLGRQIAKSFRRSRWRVALAAGVDWSHANDSAWDNERTHPAVEADRVRFDQWRNGHFDSWGESWSFEEMEQHAQWELLVTIVLAGAMTEIKAPVKYADFCPTWVCNDNFVTTIFEAR
ncbi:MAG: hypothetical protein IVW54_08305 [Candidatus Binataceae bacterium]|nr:hypothetical protein [Candidatus Binataceae bacterium]